MKAQGRAEGRTPHKKVSGAVPATARGSREKEYMVNTTDHGCSVSVGLRGNFRSSSGEEAPYVGAITFQFADRNFQQLLAEVAAGGSSPTTTFSASFSPAGQPAP